MQTSHPDGRTRRDATRREHRVHTSDDDDAPRRDDDDDGGGGTSDEDDDKHDEEVWCKNCNQSRATQWTTTDDAHEGGER